MNTTPKYLVYELAEFISRRLNFGNVFVNNRPTNPNDPKVANNHIIIDEEGGDRTSDIISTTNYAIYSKSTSNKEGRDRLVELEDALQNFRGVLNDYNITIDGQKLESQSKIHNINVETRTQIFGRDQNNQSIFILRISVMHNQKYRW